MASPLLFSQFRRRQRCRYIVMPCCKYRESVMTVTLHVSVRTWRPLIAARSSMRLLVVLASPPCSTRSRCPYLRMHAHPPGPGFPRHDPSVKIVTPFMCSYLGRIFSAAASSWDGRVLQFPQSRFDFAGVRVSECSQCRQSESSLRRLLDDVAERTVHGATHASSFAQQAT